MSEVKHTNEQVHAHGNRLWTDGTKDRGDLAHCRLQTGTHIPAGQNEANAARIALCWNSHDALVEACKQFLAGVTGGSMYPECLQADEADTVANARAALALAEKGA